MYFKSQSTETHAFRAPTIHRAITHVSLLDGKADPTSLRLTTSTSESGVTQTRISLDIKQTANRLQFGLSSELSSDDFIENSQDIFRDSAGLPGKLLPGSRVGVLTAETGTARFTRLQVVYGDDGPRATLIPAGLSNKLLARLVLKRSLLQVADAQGVARGGAFAAPVPTSDHETWFWLTPPVPSYYGHRYGGGFGFQGIGSARLTAGQPQ